MENYNRRTLKEVLEKSAISFASHPALSKIDSDMMTYSEFYKRVQMVSRFLREQGLNAGDKVALVGENMPNWGIAYFAVTSMGCVIVPVLPDFHPTEIQHILRHAGCRAVFASSRFVDVVSESVSDTLTTVIRLNDLQHISQEKKTDFIQDILQKGEESFEKLKQGALQLAGKEVAQPQAEPEEDDTAAIIYTSGTTGHSKGVMLSHKNIVFDALASESIVQLLPEDRLLSILPLAHTYECTIGFVIPIMHGSCVYYLDKTPTPRVLAAALEKVKPTIMLSVPLVIEKIFKTRILPEFNKNALIRRLYHFSFIRRRLHLMAGQKMMKFFGGSMRFFGIGGAALAPEAERFLLEAKFPYAIGYGLTETSPLIAGAGPDIMRFRSTGPALNGVEVKIINPHPESGEGEIVVRGPNVMKGYFKDPDRTREVLDEEGWFNTGDLGRLDADGFLYISGRSKNVIVGPSGENIYPEQIEAVLNEFDCVEESLVTEIKGQVTAKVCLNYEWLDQRFEVNKMNNQEMRDKIGTLLDDIKQRVNARVSSFSKIKNVIEQPEPFEKTPTHKIKRYLYT